MYSNSSTGIYRINGFKINYFPETWTWICLHHERCESKKFQLKSSVQFIQVPVVWHFQNTSKFWILQKYRHRDCHGDICWRELLFPFTHHKDGDSLHYATMSGMVLLPIYFCILCFMPDFW